MCQTISITTSSDLNRTLTLVIFLEVVVFLWGIFRCSFQYKWFVSSCRCFLRLQSVCVKSDLNSHSFTFFNVLVYWMLFFSRDGSLSSLSSYILSTVFLLLPGLVGRKLFDSDSNLIYLSLCSLASSISSSALLPKLIREVVCMEIRRYDFFCLTFNIL